MLKTQRWRDRQPKRQCSWLSLGFTLASCLGAVLTAPSTSAQISGDGSLGTTVFPLGTTFLINGGTTSGNNLFHSFSEFSVPSGNVAAFHNATTIENIIGRVTGGNISQIEGIISANGTANLFLINPAGITFGSNAIISVGGSFFASTADSILFADGVEFNAGSATANPLLTVSAPVGLAFKGSQGQIRVEGSGHNRTVTEPIFSPFIPGTPQGVQLYSGGTLALVGNQVNLDGGEVFAPGGRVEVASVRSGRVELSQTNGRWALNFPDTINFGDIQLSNRSLIDASDYIPAVFDANGEIQVAGRQISLQDGSLLLLQNFGSQQASGKLTVLASESVDMAGISSDGQIRSGMVTQALGSGGGADLQIQTNRLSIRQGARITAITYGEGQGGNVTASASESVEIDGFVPQQPQVFSSLQAQNLFAGGDAGDITINTTRLRLTNGASLSSTSFLGTGDSGDVEINATESIEVIGGVSEVLIPTNISTSSLGTGNGGNLVLNTRQLSVLDGGTVSASTLSAGRGGNIEITASDRVEVRGSLPGATETSRISASGTIAEAEIAQAFGFDFVLTGDSGNIIVQTNHLSASDGGLLAVSNQGTGNAGNLQVHAHRLELKDRGQITASTASGEGGNINLQVSELLLMRRGALISAEAGGTGNGGNITIDIANGFIVAVSGENSDIIANAFQGNGGQIDITAIGIFGLEFRDRLTDLSDITASSQFGVSGTVTISNPNTNPAALSTELQSEVLDPDQQVARGCDALGDNRFVAIGRGGLPENPVDRRSGVNAWQDVRDLSIAHPSPVTRLFSHQSPVTRDALSLPKSHPLPDSQPLVEATGWRAAGDGTVEIYAEANASLEALGTTNCAAQPLPHSNS
ncbi:MAG: filamentous hemagglutinin N-terminal domain-containing protein [Spirulina sp.]